MDLGSQSFSISVLVMTLLGGLALFLMGIAQLSDSLRAVAGQGMRNLLARLTNNRFMSAFTGAFVTAVIQSSTVTTVLVVGFVSAGLITLSQSVGVIMGANIGTTVTAHVIAFKITQYALLLVAVGYATTFFTRSERSKHLGNILLGLGLLFLGMEVMSQATYPVRTYQPMVEMLRSLDNPVIAIMVSALFTAIVQSSSATTGIVIVFASQGLVSLEIGILLAFGANIGTCLTALLASIGRTRAALQAAMIHVFFNIVGVIIWLPFVDQLVVLVREVSPVSDLIGIDKIAEEAPRQIANAHTVFNVINTLIFIGFTGLIAGLVSRIIPERPESRLDEAKPKYLDSVYIATPPLALDRIRMELVHLGQLVLEVVRLVEPRNMPFEEESLDDIHVVINDVENLYAAIVGYQRQLSRGEMSESETAQLDRLIFSANHLRSIADTITQNYLPLLQEWRKRQLSSGKKTRKLYLEVFLMVKDAITHAVAAIESDDQELAQQVIELKPVINQQIDILSKHLSERLHSKSPNRVHVFRLENQVLEVVRRLYYFSKRIAYLVNR